jgi:hypothetical protein
MFFLIRCVFWLWVVFSTIFSQTTTDGPALRRPQPPRPVAAIQPFTRTAQTWLEAAASRVADRCAASPRTCLAVAAQLSKLAADHEVAGAAPANRVIAKSKPVASRLTDIPLPPRRPSFIAAPKDARTLEKTARREYFMDQSRAEADF